MQKDIKLIAVNFRMWSKDLQIIDKIKTKRDSTKRRKTSINPGAEVGVEVDRREKSIGIVRIKKRKNTVQEEMKDLNRKIKTKEKKSKRSILVSIKMRILLRKTVGKKEKEIDLIVSVVIQAK